MMDDTKPHTEVPFLYVRRLSPERGRGDLKGRAIPLTPNLFTPTALEYRYDPVATCPEWLRFLDILWPDDAESITLLQEFMGLLLTYDTRFHKLLLIIGPTRSGKGTIGRTCRELLGKINVASPTLGSLAEQFGLAGLVAKSLALVADAVAVVERLLSIDGEAPQDIQRKHLPTLSAIRLLVRFIVLANELPRLQDTAGALLQRVLLLKTTQSFAGMEDLELGKRLLAELPGILNWSIVGWQRLMVRGRFIQPASGKELIDDFSELASPITASSSASGTSPGQDVKSPSAICSTSGNRGAKKTAATGPERSRHSAGTSGRRGRNCRSAKRIAGASENEGTSAFGCGSIPITDNSTWVLGRSGPRPFPLCALIKK